MLIGTIAATYVLKSGACLKTGGFEAAPLNITSRARIAIRRMAVGELEKVNTSRVGHSSFYTMHAAVRIGHSVDLHGTSARYRTAP